MMSSDKGKQTEPTAVLLPPMPNPSAGSANPSASLAALWNYILPALNHIFHSPTNSIDKVPTIDVSYHMGVHTAIYNYFAAQSAAAANARASLRDNVGRDTSANTATKQASGEGLYKCFDKYFTDLAQELLLGAPEDDTTLVRYIIPCFKRYSVGAHAVNRLLDYFNRCYVKRAVGGYGWLTLKSTEEEDTYKVTKRSKESRAKELKERGYEKNGSAKSLAPVDRVVPLGELALRRFRTEFIEPLMITPKDKKCGPGGAPIGDKSKSRLGRAVWEILEVTVQHMDSEEQRNLVTDLAATLRAIGIRNGHPLRMKLEKCLGTVGLSAVAPTSFTLPSTKSTLQPNPFLVS